MGKAEAGTPKDISNRMKLKGLQKLKFFCQMCKKQCRDQNGFNCHLKSETHMHNMRLFAENPNDFLSSYSKDFEMNFMDLLKKRFNKKRVLANSVYKEFIGDKTHVHMNSTRWSTLTGFVMYLHETGKVEADQTDRGLFITYQDKGLEAQKEKREEEQRIRLEKKTEKMNQMEMERQMENFKKLEETMNRNREARNEQFQDNDEDEEERGEEKEEGGDQMDIGISFNLNKGEEVDEEKETNKSSQAPFSFNFASPSIQNPQQAVSNNKPAQSHYKKELQAADDLLKQIKHDKQENKEQLQNKPISEEVMQEELNEIPWLQEGITVKIKDKELENGSYYNEKGLVKEVNSEDPFVGRIQLIKKPEIVISMDQQFLETVIPKLEGEVVILKPGQYCKKVGILKNINKETYEGIIQLKDDPSVQINIPYELFSKL